MLTSSSFNHVVTPYFFYFVSFMSILLRGRINISNTICPWEAKNQLHAKDEIQKYSNGRHKVETWRVDRYQLSGHQGKKYKKKHRWYVFKGRGVYIKENGKLRKKGWKRCEWQYEWRGFPRAGSKHIKDKPDVLSYDTTKLKNKQTNKTLLQNRC